MGNYNPHAPYVLGMEWVPIRQADYEPDQITEQGYTLALNVATAVVSGAFWAAAPPSKIVNYVAETVNIYPVGVEDQTGPIRRVLIPVSSVITTGASITNSGTAAWENPSDFFTQELATGVDLPAIGLNFAVENYTQELFGKRILGVRFLYTAGCSLNGIQQFVDFGIGNQVSMYTGDFNTFQSFVEAPVGPPAQAASALALVTDIKLVDLGNVNINLSTQLSSFGDSTALALPWRYQELLLFSTTTPLSSRRVLFIRANNFFDVDGLTGSVVFGYGALEVLYCEETRVRVGGRFTSLNTGRGFVNEGVNLVALRDVNLNLPGTLPAGEYLVTLSHHEVKPTFVARAAPRLRRLRQLYELFSHRGVIVDSRVVEGAQFTSRSTDEITTVTLHTATSIVTGSHAYGTSVGAPVYGTKTPIQEVINRGSAAVNVTQVRFYARRFGDTTVPLTFSATGGGFAVSISVADFDALPEIVDGWREVNLRLPAPSSQTAGGTSTWQWAASGEAAGNQWQVLAASNPAGPRVATPAVAATGPATYTPPLGTLLELNWQSPPISGTADDSTTDAVLLFSQEPPAVTGFAVSPTSVPVTGVGQYCGSDPRCVPTAILGNLLSWTVNSACDTFTGRTVAASWGVAESGQTWQQSGGSAAEYFVANGVGVQRHPILNDLHRSFISSIGTPDHLVHARYTIPVVPTGATGITTRTVGRYTDDNNYYYTQLFVQTSGAVTISVRRTVGGVGAAISGDFNLTTAHFAGAQYDVELETNGTQLRGRAWRSDQPKPETWQLTVTDSNLTTGNGVGPFTRLESVTNPLPIDISVDNFYAAGLPFVDTYLEVQRRDPLTDWQTIMLSSSICAHSFVDIEARVGQLSEYRIRTLNALDFAGPWVTGSGTIAAPGVTVGGDGNSLLIFTSNQSVAASLAYTMQFEGQPVEQFVFPEVDTLQLQRMFGKNFLTAFHPLERGGEQFTRVVLVNAAAVALPSLGNFRSLRDLGWASLNYVCVRDELGNRWFANVAVPEGTVRMNRTVYLAEVRVTEVTDTATPVDPGGAP